MPGHHRSIDIVTEKPFKAAFGPRSEPIAINNISFVHGKLKSSFQLHCTNLLVLIITRWFSVRGRRHGKHGLVSFRCDAPVRKVGPRSQPITVQQSFIHGKLKSSSSFQLRCANLLVLIIIKWCSARRRGYGKHGLVSFHYDAPVRKEPANHRSTIFVHVKLKSSSSFQLRCANSLLVLSITKWPSARGRGHGKHGLDSFRCDAPFLKVSSRSQPIIGQRSTIFWSRELERPCFR
jgi:hypothetical protein